jgi:hypothetical protein
LVRWDPNIDWFERHARDRHVSGYGNAPGEQELLLFGHGMKMHGLNGRVRHRRLRWSSTRCLRTTQVGTGHTTTLRAASSLRLLGVWASYALPLWSLPVNTISVQPCGSRCARCSAQRSDGAAASRCESHGQHGGSRTYLSRDCRARTQDCTHDLNPATTPPSRLGRATNRAPDWPASSAARTVAELGAGDMLGHKSQARVAELADAPDLGSGG